MKNKSPLSVVELLTRMVQIDSVNSQVSGRHAAETELASFLESLLLERGLKVRRLATPGCDNLLATYEADPSNPWLMFESHMDTVSIQGMTIPPLAAEIRDGKMWGRGTCDTKGTGASMIEALTRYMAGDKHPLNIAIAFTTDEECGMRGVKALVQDWDTLGFTPQGVIVGEPTLLVPVVANNGSVRWDIIAHGAAAHSSTPWKGRSAISDMVAIVDRIESRYIPSLTKSHPLTGKAQCSVNMIMGGVQYNIIPETCEIRLDRRLVPGEDQDQVMPDVEALLAELATERPGLRFTQNYSFSCPPLSQERNGDLARHVSKALSKLNLPVEPQGAAFGTDAGHLDHHGVPCVVIGPGDIAQAHTKDEFLSLDQLEKGVELYLAMMLEPWQDPS